MVWRYIWLKTYSFIRGNIFFSALAQREKDTNRRINLILIYITCELLVEAETADDQPKDSECISDPSSLCKLGTCPFEPYNESTWCARGRTAKHGQQGAPDRRGTRKGVRRQRGGPLHRLYLLAKPGFNKHTHVTNNLGTIDREKFNNP